MVHGWGRASSGGAGRLPPPLLRRALEHPGPGDAATLCRTPRAGGSAHRGSRLARRSQVPETIWTVPAKPLLPAAATLLPLLADAEAGRQALRGRAMQTAFAIGAGVASGSIAIATYLRHRARVDDLGASFASDQRPEADGRSRRRAIAWRRNRPTATPGVTTTAAPRADLHSPPGSKRPRYGHAAAVSLCCPRTRSAARYQS